VGVTKFEDEGGEKGLKGGITDTDEKENYQQRGLTNLKIITGNTEKEIGQLVQ